MLREISETEEYVNNQNINESAPVLKVSETKSKYFSPVDWKVVQGDGPPFQLKLSTFPTAQKNS